MLAGVLLHVVEAARPVDAAGHDLDRRVPGPGHRDLHLPSTTCTIAPSSRSTTSTTRAPPSVPVSKGCPPTTDRTRCGPGRRRASFDVADADDLRVELLQIRVGVIEAFGHGLQDWIERAGLAEAFRAQQAAVASPARAPVRGRVVAAVGEPVVEPQLETRADDLGLRHVNERREDAQPRAFDSGPRRQRGEPFERLEVFRPAIRIARVVERVHAEHDRLGPDDLRPGQRERRNTVLRAGT